MFCNLCLLQLLQQLPLLQLFQNLRYFSSNFCCASTQGVLPAPRATVRGPPVSAAADFAGGGVGTARGQWPPQAASAPASPPWHRRLRAARRGARCALWANSASQSQAELIARHHGSAIPRAFVLALVDMVAWTCKLCDWSWAAKAKQPRDFCTCPAARQQRDKDARADQSKKDKERAGWAMVSAGQS